MDFSNSLEQRKFSAANSPAIPLQGGFISAANSAAEAIGNQRLSN
jgi:hypothetical protein